jgi:hypothetical protein
MTSREMQPVGRSAQPRFFFAEAVGMISIAALALVIFSASAGSLVAPPARIEHDQPSSAGGRYTLAGAVRSTGDEAQASAAGRWRLQGRVIGGEQSTTRRADSEAGPTGRFIAKPATDVTGEGAIDLNDVLAVLQQWGTCPELSQVADAGLSAQMSCRGDLDGNGHIDACDLAMIIAQW